MGETGIEVSRLCFGTLTLAPMQKNKTLAEGREILAKAIELGINFYDTADLYDNYAHLQNPGRGPGNTGKGH